MPTLDGKQPTHHQIDQAAKELEAKVNALIDEFKSIYNPPAIVMIEGHTYRANFFTDEERLRRQYGNIQPYDFGFKQ